MCRACGYSVECFGASVCRKHYVLILHSSSTSGCRISTYRNSKAIKQTAVGSAGSVESEKPTLTQLQYIVRTTRVPASLRSFSIGSCGQDWNQLDTSDTGQQVLSWCATLISEEVTQRRHIILLPLRQWLTGFLRSTISIKVREPIERATCT